MQRTLGPRLTERGQTLGRITILRLLIKNGRAPIGNRIREHALLGSSRVQQALHFSVLLLIQQRFEKIGIRSRTIGLRQRCVLQAVPKALLGDSGEAIFDGDSPWRESRIDHGARRCLCLSGCPKQDHHQNRYPHSYSHYSKTSFSACPVQEDLSLATPSGVPAATIVPPASPPSGPRSIM